MNTPSFHRLIACLAAAALAACGRQASPSATTPAPAKAADARPTHGRIDYNRDVQLILSNACYHCHGPDTASRKAGLRLDLREQALAFKNKDGKRTIVPGKPDDSELVRRTESHDPDELMPQDPDKRLTQAQISLLREWIRQGAEFRDHWAFEKPVKAKLPETADKAWAKNEIDAFVLAKLESEHLRPSPEAGRAALIRRVTLDLTGLLPTPAEVGAFLADAAPADQAYEKVVDRLLAGDRYGEHRARYWLDYARFGDTAGLHVDNSQQRWGWRDYVIASFNADKPFDLFTREQLAGDLLPAQNVDQLVATGFVRNGINSGEGGAIVEELRVNNKRERAEAFGAVYMGMSTGCAACHDHKYDPISQKDFYALTAFFNNLAEKPSNDDRADFPPSLTVPTAQNLAAYNAALARKADIERQLEDLCGRLEPRVAAWQAGGGRAKPVSTDGLALRLRLDEDHAEGAAGSGVLRNSAPGGDPATFTTANSKPHWGEGAWLWPAFQMDANTLLELGNIGEVEKDQPFTCAMWVRTHNPAKWDATPGNGALFSCMDKAKNKGWDLLHSPANGTLWVQLAAGPNNLIQVQAEGRPERSPFYPPEGLATDPQENATLPRGMWHHVCATYDGSGKAAGVRMYLDGVPLKTIAQADRLAGSIRSGAPTHLGRRHGGDALAAASYQDVRFYRRALGADEAARLPREDWVAEILAKKPAAAQGSDAAKTWTADERKAVGDWFQACADAQSKALLAQIPALDAELVTLSQGGHLTLICREKEHTLPFAHILARGAYAARGERVAADTPHFLPPMPPGAPRNRRGLAQWVVAPENPLTARVAVNRMWQELFGVGLVETSEDFGIVGERPSHPELLDWLAVDFRENGWRVKRLYKKMVMSAAYRQSAVFPPQAAAKDPGNRLLARGPRFRMEAEMIRDIALQSSGLLVETGGPSVKPYQPANVWEAGSYPSGDTHAYRQDHGENLYRRSMYTFLKRMAPMPNMDAFDATDRANFCVRRQRTNSPMAALTLLNDPQFLEAARRLGLRAIKEGGADTDGRLQFLARTLLARPLDEAQLADLRPIAADLETQYGKRPEAAEKLLKVGETKADETVSKREQAVWMLMASTLLNADETINK